MIKVAFATTSGAKVDQHFGWAKEFHIYEVTPTGAWLHDVKRVEGEESQEDDRIAIRLQAVAGTTLLYVANIGGTAAARVIKQRIHPIKVVDEPLIATVLNDLMTVLQGTPPPWLRKALNPAPVLLEEA